MALLKSKTQVRLKKNLYSITIIATTKSKNPSLLVQPRKITAMRKGEFDRRKLSSIKKQLKPWEDIDSYEVIKHKEQIVSKPVKYPKGYKKIGKDDKGYYFYTGLPEYHFQCELMHKQALEIKLIEFDQSFNFSSSRDIIRVVNRKISNEYPDYQLISLSKARTRLNKKYFTFEFE